MPELFSADIGTCFAVSTAREGGDDDPSYRQAMSGPERQLWIDACDTEIETVSRHSAYEEVQEDLLPSWNGQRAEELVNTLWVLKEKYNELREFLKAKCRCVLDGSDQKKTAQRMGFDLNCFSPAARHTTHKCLAAAACVRLMYGKYPRRTRCFDVEGACLQGELDEKMIYTLVHRPAIGRTPSQACPSFESSRARSMARPTRVDCGTSLCTSNS